MTWITTLVLAFLCLLWAGGPSYYNKIIKALCRTLTTAVVLSTVITAIRMVSMFVLLAVLAMNPTLMFLSMSIQVGV